MNFASVSSSAERELIRIASRDSIPEGTFFKRTQNTECANNIGIQFIGLTVVNRETKKC